MDWVCPSWTTTPNPLPSSKPEALGWPLYPRDALAADVGVAAEGQGFSGVTLAHNVRTQEEVDVLLDVAVAAGATLVKPAQDAFWGGYSGYFADPDGYLWEIAWNPHFWVE